MLWHLVDGVRDVAKHPTIHRTATHNKELSSPWVDLEIIILGEGSQTEKNKYHMLSLICGTLKVIQMNLFTKQKQR